MCCTDDMLERTKDVVELHDIEAQSLKQLIDFAYTGEIDITEENVQVLLPASSLLQIQSVREACCKFLLRQLHPSNCLGIRSFAGKMSSTFPLSALPPPFLLVEGQIASEYIGKHASSSCFPPSFARNSIKLEMKFNYTTENTHTHNASLCLAPPMGMSSAREKKKEGKLLLS